jgi:serine/threonine protein kinase
LEARPFGQYQLLSLIGRGGMGEVWRAFDSATQRVVALKVLPPHLGDDETFKERFRREARVAAALYEPHVVPIHSYGEIDGHLYVDMRLIIGDDLDAVIARGPLAPTRAVGIIGQIGSALQAAHNAGLVHRDVKPSNILVAHDDFAYLIDFGIARTVGAPGLTSTGSMIGTLAYMAPERFGAGPPDPRSDVYALACVLHQCVTGQQPYPGDQMEQQVAAHLNTPPPRPSELNGRVPRSFDAVIAKGMAKNVDERYATTTKLTAAARAALAPSVPPPPPIPVYAPLPPPQPTPVYATLAAPHERPVYRRPALLIGVLVVAALIATTATVLISRGDGTTSISASTTSSMRSVTPSADPSISVSSTPATAPRGSVVTDGPLSFKVTDVDTYDTIEPSGAANREIRADGVFLIVELDVTNTTGSAATLVLAHQTITVNGSDVAADGVANQYANGTVAYDVAPGASVWAAVAFDVPPGTKADSIRVRGAPSSAGTVLSLT